MLKAIRIRNFKSFRREARLPLGHLTLLIGANASGKSNALEAIRLLKWIGEGQRLGNIRYQIQDSDSAIRGRVQDLFFDTAEPLGLGCDFDYGDWERFDLDLAYREQDDELHVIAERIHSEESSSLYEVVNTASFLGTDIRVAYTNFGSDEARPLFVYSGQKAVFTQIPQLRLVDEYDVPTFEDVVDTCRDLLSDVASIVYLDCDVQRMRDGFDDEKWELTQTGSNVAHVVAGIVTKKTIFTHAEGGGLTYAGTTSEKEKFLEFVRGLPEQDIVDILNPQHAGRASFVERFGGGTRTFDAAVLSDGTLRILAVAAALFSAPEGGLVIIEEIDNGIHPSRADGLMAKIHEIAVERNLNVVLSSHNPALMDAVPEPALPDTVFVYRDPEEGDSRMVRLGDLYQYPELISQGPLGQLVTQGIVDRMVKDPTTPEERTQAALDWLRKLG